MIQSALRLSKMEGCLAGDGQIDETIDEDSDQSFDMSELEGLENIEQYSSQDGVTVLSSSHDHDYCISDLSSFRSPGHDSDTGTYELESSLLGSDPSAPIMVELVRNIDATDPIEGNCKSKVLSFTSSKAALSSHDSPSPPSDFVDSPTTGDKSEPPPDAPREEDFHWLPNTSNVQLESDSSEEEIIRKTPKATPRNIVDDSDSDSDSVTASVKKKRPSKVLLTSESESEKMGDSPRSETGPSTRLKKRRMVLNDSLSESENSEEEIQPGEVDTHDILSSDEEKSGRRRTKRKSQDERRCKLREVKKNWKDRKTGEDSGYQSNNFKRIRSCGDSEASDDERTSGGEKWSNDEENYNIRLKDLCDSPSSSLSDFVVDGSGDPIDADTEAALQQIHGQNLDLPEAFGHYMSTLVNGALDPDFLQPQYLEKMDDYGSLIKPALQKIEDVIDAKIKLCFSSAWKPYFRETLKRRPWLRSAPANNVWTKDCEACCLHGHPYSQFSRLSGPLYHRKTLTTKPEPRARRRPTIESSSSQDDSSDSSTDSIEKNPMFDRKEYRLGVFCAQRSRIYHQLYHFKYNTFEECQRKVACVKSHVSISDDAAVFDQCMTDQSWLTQIFEKLKHYLDSADKFATAEGKNNIF